MKKWMDNNRVMYAVMLVIVALIVAVLVGFNLYLDRRASGEEGGKAEDVSYVYHVAMISGDASDVFWESMYGEAVLAGAEAQEPMYPENFGADLSEPYTAEELMRMAVAAKVDGIVVEADMTEEMTSLIGEASRANIPVITLMEDAPESDRVSYVGANSYTLGEMYGEEVLEAAPQESPQAQPSLMAGLKKGDKSKYVLQAMDYIGAHYQDPNITVGEIARHLGLSEGHLSHTFKKETDYTLLNYLTRYRIHKAMELLRDCRLKIYEVAEQVGYRDITYFSATFKKLVGISPSEYQDTSR